MSKLKDALANPTPRMKQPIRSDYLDNRSKKLHSLRIERLKLVDRLEAVNEEIDKENKHIADVISLETMSKAKVFDEDNEYQNLIDNDMAHEEV